MVSWFVHIYCFYIMVTWHYNLNIRLHTKSLHPPPAHAVQVCLAVRIIIYGHAQYIPGLSRYIYMRMGTPLLSFVCFCLVLFCSFLFFLFCFLFRFDFSGNFLQKSKRLPENYSGTSSYPTARPNINNHRHCDKQLPVTQRLLTHLLSIVIVNTHGLPWWLWWWISHFHLNDEWS